MTPLESLAKQLGALIVSFGVAREFGRPELVQKAAEEAERTFQGHTKAKPSKDDAYAAAHAFLRGQSLDDRQIDLVASALAEPIREMGKAKVLGHRDVGALLRAYVQLAEDGDLWRLTWYGLLGSYFAFDPQTSTKAEAAGWLELRATLQRTWPAIDRESGAFVVPDWIRVLRGDPGLLSDSAADRYALDYLRGEETGVKQLSDDLGIPDSSWFWHALVLGAVKRSAGQSDSKFKESLPRLLSLMQARPANRDEALETVLSRYHRCAQPTLHQELRDYVVRKDVWKNPKLRAAGMATAWNRVGDEVWQMVLQWVNEANLKDFFEILAARRNSDEGRLEFWSQYMEQISWTRLIFSSQTRQLAHSSPAIRNLIAREEGSYATMSANQDVDAFMLQLGDYVFVEFSRTPNAAYGYKADELPFDPYDREYMGTTTDLKFGFRGERAARISHMRDWQSDAKLQLSRLGIQPDASGRASRPGTGRIASDSRRRGASNTATSRPETPALPVVNTHARPVSTGRSAESPDGSPAGAAFTMKELRMLLSKHPGSRIQDRRDDSSGRLWVIDDNQSVALGIELKRLGFRWAASRQSWYFPEK